MHISLYLYAMAWCPVLTADVHGGGTAVCTPADVVAGVLGGMRKYPLETHFQCKRGNRNMDHGISNARIRFNMNSTTVLCNIAPVRMVSFSTNPLMLSLLY
jgi:hypothetical protein